MTTDRARPALTPICPWCGDNCGPSGGCLCPASLEIAALRAELLEASAAYAQIAHALGIELATDGRATEPGPLDDVLRALGDALEAERERDELRAVADAARVVCEIVPPPDESHARHAPIVLAVAALRAALPGDALEELVAAVQNARDSLDAPR